MEVYYFRKSIKYCRLSYLFIYRVNKNNLNKCRVNFRNGPVLTAILSTVLLRKIPTFIQILGFTLGSIGVLFIVLSGEGGLAGLSSGDLFVFLSILSLALSSIVISKAAKTLDPRVLTDTCLF